LEKQGQVLEKHIQLAKDNDLPLVCHGRNSKDDFALQTVYFDILKVLDNMGYSKGVIHCFSGTIHEAQSIINAGMYIGFTGIVTFPKTDELTYVIKETPLDKILIETDSPYLTPQEHRGKRNEPIYVMEVAQKIAEIKGIKVEELIKQVWENSKKLFKI
jgi:TatD DNase family protein